MNKVGIVGDMMEYRETREYFHNVGETIQAHYLEVIEKSSEDEDSDGNQGANKGFYPWDYFNSDAERMFIGLGEEEYEIEENARKGLQQRKKK